MTRREEVTSKVKVLDISVDDPASLLFAQRAVRADGKVRTITQKIRVLDAAVLSRLTATVNKGDDIEVTIITEWSKSGYSTSLLNFRAASAHTEEETVLMTMTA